MVSPDKPRPTLTRRDLLFTGALFRGKESLVAAGVAGANALIMTRLLQSKETMSTIEGSAKAALENTVITAYSAVPLAFGAQIVASKKENRTKSRRILFGDVMVAGTVFTGAATELIGTASYLDKHHEEITEKAPSLAERFIRWTAQPPER